CAGTRFKGIRQIGAWDPDSRLVVVANKTRRGMYRDERLVEGVARLAAYGLSFDAWAYHPQLSDVVYLARQCTNTRIVVNHCGGPLRLYDYTANPANEFAQWRKNIQQLASLENVSIKLGGLGMIFNGFRFF